MSKNGKSFGVALRMFCAMLIVSLTFAHKPVMASPVSDPASYVLPDGSIASLCIPDSDGKQGKHLDHGCEACRIVSSSAMPLPPIEACEVVRAVVVVSFVFAPERFHRLNFPPSAPPRGPPSFPVSFVVA